jgi:hypothetical protein
VSGVGVGDGVFNAAEKEVRDAGALGVTGAVATWSAPIPTSRKTFSTSTSSPHTCVAGVEQAVRPSLMPVRSTGSDRGRAPGREAPRLPSPSGEDRPGEGVSEVAQVLQQEPDQGRIVEDGRSGPGGDRVDRQV